MRIAKFLAAAEVASRRQSEKIITDGKVFVNGSRVTNLATQIDEKEDVVTVSGRRVRPAEQKIYIMLNKPVGCVCTCSDEKGRKTVLDYLKGIDRRVYPVGRLDFTTEGLLILTNDGELANKLMHPSYKVNKRYYAVVNDELSDADIASVQKGVMIEGRKTAPAQLKIMKMMKGRTEFTIVVHEGRNHLVKNIFEALGKQVVFLKRISVGTLQLGDLKSGQYRFLNDDELAYLNTLK